VAEGITWTVLVGFGAGSSQFATVQEQHPTKCYMRFHTLMALNFQVPSKARDILMVRTPLHL